MLRSGSAWSRSRPSARPTLQRVPGRHRIALPRPAPGARALRAAPRPWRARAGRRAARPASSTTRGERPAARAARSAAWANSTTGMRSDRFSRHCPRSSRAHRMSASTSQAVRDVRSRQRDSEYGRTGSRSAPPGRRRQRHHRATATCRTLIHHQRLRRRTRRFDARRGASRTRVAATRVAGPVVRAASRVAIGLARDRRGATSSVVARSCAQPCGLGVLVSALVRVALQRPCPSVRRRSAGAAGAEDLEGVADVGVAVGGGDGAGPLLHGRALDLDGGAAGAADQVVVVGGAAAAVDALAGLGAQRVDLAGVGQRLQGRGRPSRGRPARRARRAARGSPGRCGSRRRSPSRRRSRGAAGWAGALPVGSRRQCSS